MNDKSYDSTSKAPPQRPPVILPDGKLPQPLGSGTITSLLGSGGMSNVYKIWNPQMESPRAVKLMKPDLNQESQQRFQTEIKIMAALSHPNIIEIHSVGEWNTLAYIEMDYIDGLTLAEIIELKGALPIPVCLSIAILIGRALDYAHNKEYVLYGKKYKGIIHRDLKPSNIMIDRDGRVILMDFGIARPVETSLMTLDGAVMGTMQYLAPEQIDGKNVGVTADLYSLGAVLYETLTGKKVFPQKNLSQLMSYKIANNFIPLRMFKIKIPPRLKTLVDRSLMHKADKRPPTAHIVLEQLEDLLKRITPDTPEAVLQSFMRSSLDTKTELIVRGRFPVAAMIIAALSIVAIVAGALFFFHPGPTRQATVAQPEVAPPVIKIDTPATTPAVPSVEKPAPPRQTAVKKPRPSARPTAAREAAPKTAEVKVTQPDTVASQPASHLDGIKAKYGIADPVELMIKEAATGNYASVLTIFDEIPAQNRESDQAQLLRLRALFALGNNAEMAAFFSSTTIEDGEYCLIKAKYLYKQGLAEQALPLLDKGAKTGTLLLDAASVRRSYLFYRARCLTALFDRTGGEEKARAALDAWFEVKNFLHRTPNHENYQKAVAEMQRIGDLSERAAGAPDKTGDGQ